MSTFERSYRQEHDRLSVAISLGVLAGLLWGSLETFDTSLFFGLLMLGMAFLLLFGLVKHHLNRKFSAIDLDSRYITIRYSKNGIRVVPLISVIHALFFEDELTFVLATGEKVPIPISLSQTQHKQLVDDFALVAPHVCFKDV